MGPQGRERHSRGHMGGPEQAARSEALEGRFAGLLLDHANHGNHGDHGIRFIIILVNYAELCESIDIKSLMQPLWNLSGQACRILKMAVY